MYCWKMINIIDLILQYDNTYNIKFNYCIDELNYYIKKHKAISVTYLNVVDEQRKFFRDFDIDFHKYIKIKLNKIFY